MRLLLIWLCALGMAPLLPAGTIHGMILEYSSGLPLARAKVYLELVEAGGIRRLESVYTSRGGQFDFGARPEGLYLVSAERDSYALAAFGQRRPEGFGAPFAVTRDSNHFIELRLRKLGVLTGVVRDENGVGVPGVNVYAVPRRLPARALANGRSDDRGVYRVHSLPPGKYWVRSGAHTFNETNDGIVPTFAPEQAATLGARVFEAKLDIETTFSDVRPMAGRMETIRGSVLPCAMPGVVTVTLSTEEGNRTVQTGCGGGFVFENVAPGPRDIAAVLQGPECWGAFEDLRGRDRPVPLQLQECGFLRVGRSPTGDMQVLLRRRDLGVDGPWIEMPSNGKLPPGFWEIAPRLAAKEYVSGLQQAMLRREHGPDGYTVFVPVGRNTGAVVTVRVSDGAGSIAGTVRRDGNGVPAAPVFLWPATDGTRRAMGGPRTVRAGADGRFRFDGLPPGNYRVMSSYDFREVDEEAMELAAPGLIVLTAGQAETVTLQPFETR